MFRVEVNNGQIVIDYDESEVPTIGDMVNKFRNDNGYRFAAEPVVYDSSQGSAGPVEWSRETCEGRIYAMTCWITQKVDEAGNPIKRGSLI